MSVRVKICGVTRAEDAMAAVNAGADLIGLNFYPQSPRYLSVERARDVARAVAGRAKLVGVFVRARPDQMIEAARALALDLVQLHDAEDEGAPAGVNVPIIRALRVKPGTGSRQLGGAIERARAEYVLLDSYDSKLYGGTGVALALEDLAQIDLSRVFIAGGLTPDTVASAARLNPYGVDVASGVESSPGVKDHHKLRSFIHNAKSSR